MSVALVEKGIYLKDRHAYVLGGEPLVFHCHHYNCFLQASIEDTRNLIDPYPILVDCAHAVVYAQLQRLKEELKLDTQSLLEQGVALFRSLGFGILQLDSISAEKGVVVSPSEHYGVGWFARYGKRHEDLPGVSFFARGFIEALVEVAFDLPKGTIYCEQTHCLAKGDDQARFEYRKENTPRAIPDSPGEGMYEPVVPMQQPKDTSIDYYAIRDAVLGMPLEGDEEEGLIDAFGVLLTRMYANYYNLLTCKVMDAITQEIGPEGALLVENLLREAGHVCAFNTMGGIMISPEWDALILPQIKERKDWLHGIVAVMNALGWGVIQIEEIKEYELLKLRIYSDYENNGLIPLKLQYNRPAAFLFQGMTAGLMNLLYKEDITQKPTLNAVFYNKVFREGEPFIGSQERDRRLHGDYCITIAQRGNTN